MLTILTNAIAARQRSMLGYGGLLLDTARRAGLNTTERRGVSLLGGPRGRLLPDRARKLLRNIDRLALTPLAFAGRGADVAHVVDPGNVVYLDVLRSRRTICTVHDLIPHLAEAGRLAGFTPTRGGRRLMRAIRARLARVDRVVCVSEATRRDLLDLIESPPPAPFPLGLRREQHHAERSTRSANRIDHLILRVSGRKATILCKPYLRTFTAKIRLHTAAKPRLVDVKSQHVIKRCMRRLGA